jgi:hypothetical protein
VETEARLDAFPDLLLLDTPPPVDHPADLYVAERTPRSRDGAREALDVIAALLTGGQGRAATVAWTLIRAEHVEAVRAALAERYPPVAGKRILGVLRGLLTLCARRGLIPAGEYKRAREAALHPPQAAHGELRSLLASCAEDETRHPRGAVRTLLFGNGASAAGANPDANVGGAMVKVPEPGTPAARSGPVIASLVRLHLRRGAHREAIAHALWEAGACVRASAFCACLAMLRKALDLWAIDYAERHRRSSSDREGGSADLTVRLMRIAAENEAHRAAIHLIAESLGHDAPDAYSALVCRGGSVTGFNGYALSRVKETYRDLHEAVVTLIAATIPDLPL